METFLIDVRDLHYDIDDLIETEETFRKAGIPLVHPYPQYKIIFRHLIGLDFENPIRLKSGAVSVDLILCGKQYDEAIAQGTSVPDDTLVEVTYKANKYQGSQIFIVDQKTNKEIWRSHKAQPDFSKLQEVPFLLLAVALQTRGYKIEKTKRSLSRKKNISRYGFDPHSKYITTIRLEEEFQRNAGPSGRKRPRPHFRRAHLRRNRNGQVHVIPSCLVNAALGKPPKPRDHYKLQKA